MSQFLAVVSVRQHLLVDLVSKKITPISGEPDVTFAAKMAVRAVETNSLEEWLGHLKEAPHCGFTELGILLRQLREAFWHSGTYKQREKVWVLTAKIKFKIMWDSEQGTKS